MKQIFVILPVLFSLSASSQNPHFPKLKIDVPCTQEFLDSYKGKWLKPDAISNGQSKDFMQGGMNRIQEVQQLFVQIYPQPLGADVNWSGGYAKSYFAEKVKYIPQDGINRPETISQNIVNGWNFHLGISPWYCDHAAKNTIMNGYPDIGDATGIVLNVNNIEAIVNGAVAEDDMMTINQQPIKYKMPVIGKWKGYDVMNVVAAGLSNERFILITRNGMLPYIPVTRKQYLDRAIAFLTKTYDEWITLADNDPDKAQAAANKKRTINDKSGILKKYRDELEASAKNGSLDLPAIIQRIEMFPTDATIFSTEAEGGRMLVTNNPTYFRKDLPGFIPQTFVLQWMWGSHLKSSADFRKAFEDNFPVEKLQEMIDR